MTKVPFGLLHPDFMKWCETVAHAVRYDDNRIDEFSVSLVLCMLKNLGFTIAPPKGEPHMPIPGTDAALSRRRWLIKLLQHAVEQEGDAGWAVLVRRACDYGVHGSPAPKSWEFDQLRTETIAHLYGTTEAGRDAIRAYRQAKVVQDQANVVD